jgi:hypothetical protein
LPSSRSERNDLVPLVWVRYGGMMLMKQDTATNGSDDDVVGTLDTARPDDGTM